MLLAKKELATHEWDMDGAATLVVSQRSKEKEQRVSTTAETQVDLVVSDGLLEVNTILPSDAKATWWWSCLIEAKRCETHGSRKMRFIRCSLVDRF